MLVVASAGGHRLSGLISSGCVEIQWCTKHHCLLSRSLSADLVHQAIDHSSVESREEISVFIYTHSSQSEKCFYTWLILHFTESLTGRRVGKARTRKLDVP